MKKIAIYTMICGILGFLAVVNIFTAQQVKYLSDITLSIQAQAGDGGSDGSVEGSGDGDQWKYPKRWVEEPCFYYGGAFIYQDVCKRSPLGRVSCEEYDEGYGTGC